MGDLIDRQVAIDAINHICPVDTEYDCTLLDRVDVRCVLSNMPSAQPDGLLERHKDEILKAGMEGREVEFRIGRRLFAIREKAQ